ncbi:unnamed protein product [Paramecium pentaurelia]|uniref:Transmembrane protein n=1 Tax=Paramecium pentaurelia TaxID=43138 RepID=A0A8S1X679_9CILI|nr:unnamed protein product [Paramecium pentaurelia]
MIKAQLFVERELLQEMKSVMMEIQLNLMLALNANLSVKLNLQIVNKELLKLNMYQQSLVSTIKPLTQTNLNIQSQYEFIEPIQDPVLQVVVERNTIHNQFQFTWSSFYATRNYQKQLIQFVKLNDAMMYLLTGNFLQLIRIIISPYLIQGLWNVNFPEIYQNSQTSTPKSHCNRFIEQVKWRYQQSLTEKQFELRSLKYCKLTLFIQFQKLLFFCYSIYIKLLYLLHISIKILQTIIFKLENKFRNNLIIIKMIHLFKNKLKRNAQLKKIQYFSKGIFKVYETVIYQYMFSAVLSFPNHNFDSPFEIFNNINAIIGLLFILMVTFSLLSITQSIIKRIGYGSIFILKYSYLNYITLLLNKQQESKNKFAIVSEQLTQLEECTGQVLTQPFQNSNQLVLHF